LPNVTWYSREDAADRVRVEPSYRPRDAGRALGRGVAASHVGLHAGPVLFREGDYFGQTVTSARIADYARQGRCWSARKSPTPRRIHKFADIGPVELKGVSGAVHLLRADFT